MEQRNGYASYEKKSSNGWTVVRVLWGPVVLATSLSCQSIHRPETVGCYNVDHLEGRGLERNRMNKVVHNCKTRPEGGK
jgi:hypothetical protein